MIETFFIGRFQQIRPGITMNFIEKAVILSVTIHLAESPGLWPGMKAETLSRWRVDAEGPREIFNPVRPLFFSSGVAGFFGNGADFWVENLIIFDLKYTGLKNEERIIICDSE